MSPKYRDEKGVSYVVHVESLYLEATERLE